MKASTVLALLATVGLSIASPAPVPGNRLGEARTSCAPPLNSYGQGGFPGHGDDNDSNDDNDDNNDNDDDDKPLACPAGGTLPSDGSYIKPSLMVVVNKDEPDKAYGSTAAPRISANEFCTIFNLELDQRAYNKTCNLVFDIPSHAQTHTPFYFSGAGTFTFTGYAFGVGADEATTYNHQPESGPSPPNPPPNISPGHSYVINSAPCGIPEGVAPITVSGMLCSTDTDFIFKQSDETCPVGFFVVLT